MDKEVALFTEPEELITWADQFDILLNITREEAELLLNYMEGHDYAIGHNDEGKLYQVDIAEENGEVMELKIDDIIDTVCNWNYDLILCTNAIKEETDSFEELVQLMVEHDMAKVAVERAEEHIRTNLAEYLEKGVVK